MYINGDNLMIMYGVHKRETFREMAETIGISIATIHERLQDMVDDGLISPPPRPNLARAYKLTKRGYEMLELNMPNLIAQEAF